MSFGSGRKLVGVVGWGSGSDEVTLGKHEGRDFQEGLLRYIVLLWLIRVNCNKKNRPERFLY